jgi:hypothetical protein
MFPGITGNDKTGNMNFLAFKVLGETVFINDTLIWDTVVSNQRIRKDKDLASVTWVRQGFRVSDHSSVENNFTSSGNRCTERSSFERCSIGHVQQGFFTLKYAKNRSRKWNMERKRKDE